MHKNQHQEGSSVTQLMPQPQALIRRDWLMACALATIVLIAGSWRMTEGVCGLNHDDAIYVSTAKAMADGQGYRLINLPGSPNQTKYPVLFPSVLALVWRIWPSFPSNLWAMQGLCLLSCAGAIGLGYLYLVRFNYFSRNIAAASGLICATTPLFLYYGAQTLSEMPFTLLLIMACWSLDKTLAARPRSWKHQIFVGVLLSLPFWCRTIGVVLVPFGLLVVRRSERPMRWIATGAIASISPWIIWTLLGLATRKADPTEMFYTDYVSWWSMLGLPMLARVFFRNAAELVFSFADFGLEGCKETLVVLAKRPYLLSVCIADYVVTRFLGALAWLPFIRQARQGRVLPWCLTGYLLLVAVWPWPPERFVMPILPMLLAYMLLGISWLAALRLSSKHVRCLGIVGISVAITANTIFLYQYTQLSHRTGCPYNSLLDDHNLVYWRSFQRLFDWVDASTQPDAVVATDMDTMFYLYTGRRGIRPFVNQPGAMFYGLDGPKLGTVEEFTHTLKVYQPGYIVMTPMQFLDQPFARLVDQAQQRYPGWIRQVYQDPEDPRFAIFELHPEMEPSSSQGQRI